jgi:hypothetical protein
MAENGPSIAVLVYIAQGVLAPAERRKLWGSPHVRFKRYLGCYQEAFEVGAVLGHAYRNTIFAFAKLLSEPGHEAEFISFIQQLARERLAGQSEPKSFFDLAMNVEEKRVKGNWLESGITESQVHVLEEHQKIPSSTALKNLIVAISTGIGLGSAFPELTERLWNDEHCFPVSSERWRAAKAAGIISANEPNEPPTGVSLTERQSGIVNQLEKFVSAVRPELLPALAVSP